MQDQIFYLLSALLAGVVLGAVIMYYLSHSSSNKGKTIEKVEQDLEDYKHDVAVHFETTANLVEELTQNYKRVFDHLGQSAKHLMSEEELKNQIEKRKGNKVTLEFLNEDESSFQNNQADDVEESTDLEETIEDIKENAEEAEINELSDENAEEVVDEILVDNSESKN